MRKSITRIILSLFLLGLGLGAAMAQETSMKSQAIESLSFYGQQLYDRADYEGAAKVFGRIVRMDANNQNALSYLRAIKSKGVLVSFPQAQEIRAKALKAEKIHQPIAIKKVDTVEVVINEGETVALDRELAQLQHNLKSLRQSLQERNQQISALEKQLAQ